MSAAKWLGKQEAVEVLNLIMKKCVMPRFIALEMANPEQSKTSQNFNIRIRGPFDAKDWSCLKGIIQRHGLSMKETGNDIIIYRQEL